MRRTVPPILAIFITVLIDLLGFGMLISDIQLRGRELGASGLILGLMLSSYSICQFLFAPMLGRLSDRVGRRPVLVITVLLSICCFISYAYAKSIIWIFISRGLAGVAGANISVAYAYIADITKPKDRAKSLGLIGAAFAIGFILGVPFGALLIEWGGGKPMLLGYAAASLSCVNLLFVLFGLPESLNRENALKAITEYQPPYKALWKALQTPRINFLLLLYFAANFAFSNLESTFLQLNVFQFHISQSSAALVLAYIGIVSAIIQGGLIRRLVPAFGEANLIRVGYFIQSPALIMLPFSLPWLSLLIAVTALSLGRGFSDPCLNSLISRETPPEMQGQIFGLTQSTGALARMTSPTIANILFGQAHWLPYLCAGLVMLLPLFGSLRLRIWPENVDMA